MEILTEKIDLNNLDKSNWETFKFDEIAQKISKTIDPNETTLETYVGLEHIDAEDLHIRRKGTPDDVKGGKLRCYPGDIIFGKRRAYQRKAAIVDFDGICSAHAFVLRANSEVIDSKLFPFFLHSNQFMHRMVDISVGGLSPTINWGDLKHQEFLLPPKDQQVQLAKLLWAMDEVIEKEKELINKLKTNYLANRKKKLNDQSFYEDRIEDLAKTSAGGTPSTKREDFWNGDVPWINSGKLKNELISSPSKMITKLGLEKSSAKLWDKDTTLIALTGATTGEVGYLDFECSGNQSIVAVKSKGEIIDKYFFYYLIEFKHRILQQAIGSAQPHINKNIVDKFKLRYPEIEKQRVLVNEFDRYVDLMNKNLEKISSSKSLQKSIINQIF